MSQIISRPCVASLLTCDAGICSDNRAELLHGTISQHDLVRIQRAANLVKEDRFRQVRMHPSDDSVLAWYKDGIGSNLDGRADHDTYVLNLKNDPTGLADVACEEFIVYSDHFVIVASPRHLLEYGMQSGRFPIEALYDKRLETKSYVGDL